MSKSLSVTQLHNVRQQGGKNVQIGRPQTMLSTSSAKSVTSLDEFKYGFPSNGLSTVSNKWWGSSCSEGYEDICGHGANTDGVSKQQFDNVADNDASSVTVDKEQHEGDGGGNVGPQGTGLLMAVRKRIADEGRDALKLGVIRSSGIKKLGRREKTLLLRIFKSSIPKQWIHGTS